MSTTSYPTLRSMSPQFLVTDLNRSMAFYTEKLGFEISFCYQDFYCGIIKDDHSIHLKLADAPIKVRGINKDNDRLDLLFSVGDIGSLYECLKTIGVTIIEPLREMPYGQEFYITDPDGHIIAFVEEKQ